MVSAATDYNGCEPSQADAKRSADLQPTPRAIEDPSFPFEHLSTIAELESWRKEISRPIYHIHKWWAQRLGSVFRAILIAAPAETGADVLDLFYRPMQAGGVTVFDPFMGSGTTIGEALKLGDRAIGRDINPVAHFIGLNAFGPHGRQKVLRTYSEIERDVAPAIQRLYRAKLPNGDIANALYYFWVKVVSCPICDSPVDLFSSYIFAQHAYPSSHPQAEALCPHCGTINIVNQNTRQATCSGCEGRFDLRAGPAHRATATCPKCHSSFRIAETVRRRDDPPAHRLYAKLVLLPDGSKQYLAADSFDAAVYEVASALLKQQQNPYPIVAIHPGYNTNQVLNYRYHYWHQMFNDRQLLGLSLLANRIRAIPDESLRQLFTCLFSGTLEFNNMFASYKGEGTGAVRHMFSHHILKPERTPLEANVWGTPKSSGAFSTLFKSRILRALDYRDNPFELRVISKSGKPTGHKVSNISRPIGSAIAQTYLEFESGQTAYLSCGDSAHTDIPTGTVDAVVTDPPFFDNVHYSQLADFFYVWQRHILDEARQPADSTTRSAREVQQSDPARFTRLLSDVWLECHRVLRPDGLLVFTYHHSRAEGWHAVLAALMNTGFAVTAAHPIKAEMSVAVPKHQAAEPIDLDVILVCRKRQPQHQPPGVRPDMLTGTAKDAADQIQRLNNTARLLSRNDVRVVLMGQLLRRLSQEPSFQAAEAQLLANSAAIERMIELLFDSQRPRQHRNAAPAKQLTLSL